MSEALPPVSLDDILITPVLAERAASQQPQRSARTPNLQAETQALHLLARQLAEQSQTMLKTLATVAQDLCQAGTAGVSLLEVSADGEECFRWEALAGALEGYAGRTTPRSFSPCGVCLDRQAPQLYSYPERYFTYFDKIKPSIVEVLVVPLMSPTQLLGTIWVMSHVETRQFDAEDVRIVTSLADFTAAALQSIHLRQTAEMALQQEQTARREAEVAHQALDESAQRAIEILESITDAFVCVDHDWRITYVNQEAAHLSNLHPNDMMGKTYQELQAWAIGTVIEHAHYRIMAEPEATHFEVLHRPAKMWLEVHAYPCKVGFSIYFRDITGRKQDKIKRRQAEAALRDSESRFRLIVESAKDYAIFTLDLHGMITTWNSGAERLLGYTEAEIVGQPSHMIFTPEDRESGQAQQELQKTLSEGRAEDNRWHLRKDGSRFFASGYMMQLHDEAGNLQGLVKILRDMTEAHQAKERDQFLSQASAVLAGTLDYKTMLFNMAWLAVPFLADFCFFDILNSHQQIERVAWHYSEATERDWFELLQHSTPPLDRKNHPITQVLTSGTANLVSHVTEAWVQSTAIDADYRQFIQEGKVQSLMTVPLVAHGRILGALTVCLTTNSNRHYTQTDLTLVEEFGRRAALALDNAQLYQQAQESNRLKDEFMAVLSHELRSPLNPILGWLQLVRKGNLSEAQFIKAWTTIERNAKLQAQLVEDLLDVSRILRGKLNLQSNRVNLVETIQAAIETVQLAAQAKSINLRFTVCDVEVRARQTPKSKIQTPILNVLGDATRLQQVVWNLLSNAIKFTPTGGQVEVRLEPMAEAPEGGTLGTQEPHDIGSHNLTPSHRPCYAQIQVKDTGIGIDRTFLPYVFDYFRQSDSATTRRFGGLGLGLAIVRQIVEAHGGMVEVASLGAGQGATFTVKLPMIAVPTNRPPNSSIVENDLNAEVNLEGIRILAVDNEPDSLEFIATVLEQAGADVTVATSADAALTLFSQFRPDLLLSDIAMPDMDGYTLMQHVRLLEASQQGAMALDVGEPIPAIALTAYVGDINYHQATAVGFQRHIAKPVEPEMLIQVIADLIQLHRDQ